MNKRSIIFQIGALAFCISIIVMSLSGFSVLEMIIKSFILFVGVTICAIILVAIVFPNPKENDKKEDFRMANNPVTENALHKEKSDNINPDGVKERKEDQSTETSGKPVRG